MATSSKKSESKSAKLSGKCKWAQLDKPNIKFEPMWKITIVLENETLIERLKATGLNVKQDNDGDWVLDIKRKVNSKDKKTGEVKVNNPPVVMYEGEEFHDKIGNGSHVTCEFSVYDWDSFGKKGVGVWLNAVTINELVPYGKKTDLDFDSEVSSDVPF